jgi:hypothetical protein
VPPLPRILHRLRRALPHAPEHPVPTPPRTGLWTDPASRTATADGIPLSLTPLGFDLVWGGAPDSDPGRVKYVVLRLPRKITAMTEGRPRISTGPRGRLPLPPAAVASVPGPPSGDLRPHRAPDGLRTLPTTRHSDR